MVERIVLVFMIKTGNWIGLIGGINEIWAVESNGSLGHKVTCSAPNMKVAAYSSRQTDGVITGIWRNNQCKMWYIPYGSSYITYVRCVTLTKNANGEIQYDSSLPKWEFRLPTPSGYDKVTNAGICINPYDDTMVTISGDADATSGYTNDRVIFYTLKLNDYSGTGWGTMTCGDLVTSIATSGQSFVTGSERTFQYRANGKVVVYGNYAGRYNGPVNILFTDDNGFVKYVTSLSTNIIVFKNDMTKCIANGKLYNLTTDFTNHTCTLGNYITMSSNVGGYAIGDIYDHYILANTVISGYPDNYPIKLFNIDWETGAMTTLVTMNTRYSFGVSLTELPSGNLNYSNVDGATSSSYGVFLSIRLLKKIDYMSYDGVNYYPEKLKQTKTITPTYSQQTITPDTGYELESVIVNEIPAVTLDIENATVENGVLKEEVIE